MFKALMKVRLKSLWQSMFSKMAAKNKKRNPVRFVLFLLFALYIIAALLMSIGGLFYQIAGSFHAIGFDWLYFSFVVIACFSLNFIGSVFMTQNQIFDAKDNNLLLSMPIPMSYILASRMLTLVFLNSLYTLLIAIPAIIVYFMQVPFSISILIMYIIGILFIPIFTMAITCVVAWIIALISSKMRNKNLIIIVLLLTFFGAYMYFAMNIQTYIGKLITKGETIGNAIRNTLPPFYSFGKAIADVNYIDLVMFIAWAVIPFVAIYMLLTKSFLKIATSNKGLKKVKYVQKELKVSSIRNSLILKELKHFVSLPMYMFNCGIGVVMELFLAGALIVKKDEIVKMFIQQPGLDKFIPLLLCLMSCFCIATIDISAPSISLEGPSLWILRSNPIKTTDIFFAKIATNFIIGAPVSIILSVVGWFTIPMGLFEKIILLIVPLIFLAFISIFGLVSNVWFPKLQWINTTVVVKQSMSVMITVFGGLAAVALPIIGVFLLLKIPSISSINMNLYAMIWACIFMIINIVMVLYLKGAGKRKFETL